MSEKEIRRCLSYADVYEVTDAGDVLLTLENYLEDNSDATPATDVPEVELLYPRGGAPEEDEEDETAAEAAKTKQVATPVKAPVKQENTQKAQNINTNNNQKNNKYTNTPETKKENTEAENK